MFLLVTNKNVYLHNGNEKERYGKTSKILKSISETNGCKLVKREKPINIELGIILPDDLRFYLKIIILLRFGKNQTTQ